MRRTPDDNRAAATYSGIHPGVGDGGHREVADSQGVTEEGRERCENSPSPPQVQIDHALDFIKRAQLGSADDKVLRFAEEEKELDIKDIAESEALIKRLREEVEQNLHAGPSGETVGSGCCRVAPTGCTVAGAGSDSQFSARPRFGDEAVEGAGGSVGFNPCGTSTSASGSCSIHTHFGSGRIGTVDGGPASGSSRGSQFGRHQSHFGVDFKVERRRRTVGGDERWHVAVTRQSLYGLRGLRIGEASQAQAEWLTAARAKQHYWTPSSKICVHVHQSLKWMVPTIEGGVRVPSRRNQSFPLGSLRNSFSGMACAN